MPSISNQIESIVLNIHWRNGGTLSQLDFSLRLLDPVLSIDSLDLAEIVVEVERRFRCSPFDSQKPPRTWQEMVNFIQTESK